MTVNKLRKQTVVVTESANTGALPVPGGFSSSPMHNVYPLVELGSGGGGATNLAYTAAPTNGTVTSDTGNDATIPLATGTNAGLLPPVPATTALTAGGVDQAADYFLIWDNSATAYKKILANFVTPSSIVQENVTISGGNAGASLRVTATATGTTCSYSSGAYVITIPVGQTLISAQLICVTADIQAAADGGGFTDWITIQFVNTDGNSGVTTLRVPQVQKGSIPTSGALAANNGMSIDNDSGFPWFG